MDHRYEEALERARKGMPIDEVFPELKESEDEKIRKTLIHIVKGACCKYGIKYRGDGITEEKLLSYLERQKEQQPAEWSEEDENIYNKALDALYYKDCNEKYDVIEALEGLCDLISRKRKVIPPYAHWKPSEEQMEALDRCVEYLSESDNEDADVMNSLLTDLQKLL